MRKALIALLLLAAPSFAQTLDNDHSCDVSLEPAATLLLPYFEVALQQGQQTTLFTVLNVSPNPQIARVTIWTDYGYPLFTFNLYIGGYGVAPIDLYDVLVNGVINPGSQNPAAVAPTPGTQPNASNAQIDPRGCASTPIYLQQSVIAVLQQVLTVGKGTLTCGNAQVGGVHPNLIGFATIDLVANCNARQPSDPAYFTNDLLFDNVLAGDYQQRVNGIFLGNTLVHIRAVPEGGAAGQVVATLLPYTFYDRMTNGLTPRTIDRRQPLPSTFIARWLGGGPDAFSSDLRIWREPPVGAGAACTAYASNAMPPVEEIIRFDEHENASVVATPVIGEIPPPQGPPATSRIGLSSAVIPPPPPSGDLSGWLWLALSNGGSNAYSVTGPHHYAGGSTMLVRQSQAWVVTSMAASGKYVVSNDAVAIGNGCSAAPPISWQQQLGPAPNPTP